MNLPLDSSVIVASIIQAVFNGITLFFVIRYLNKIVEGMEHHGKRRDEAFGKLFGKFLGVLGSKKGR